ncbi:hypothetical protein OE88DRAFT_1648866 [Heliocybe sulcata]|uniref:Uncharacterized protein n=1 Tax=Heliocybe sulcata TaxID=5364 RepID=A0A5C3MKQ0_9AGAM|nr:hypothetical protein OE88DRAFT_1648866 [Heliocybe sulcata]
MSTLLSEPTARASAASLGMWKGSRTEGPQSVLTPENVFHDASVSYMGTLGYSRRQRLLDSICQPGYPWATALPVDISKAASAPATAAYSASSSVTRPLSSSRPTYIQSERQ